MARLDVAGDLVTNREQRTPCILVLDTSGSMHSSGAIRELNEGLQLFETQLKKDKLAALRCEVAIVTFGGENADLVQDFVTVDQFKAPQLAAHGSTPMGAAIDKALEVLRTRKTGYKSHDINYTRPWMFVITDGEPTDTNWQAAVARLRSEEAAKGVIVFPVGVVGANEQVLQSLSSNAPAWLESVHFTDFFKWLSTSQAIASAGAAGTSAQMPSTDAWNIVQR